MATTRRSYQGWLPTVFDDFFDNDWSRRANAMTPAINVLESPTGYEVEVAAPGLTKDDFNIHIDEDNNLVIAMEKKSGKRRNTANQGGDDSYINQLSVRK